MIRTQIKIKYNKVPIALFYFIFMSTNFEEIVQKKFMYRGAWGILVGHFLSSIKCIMSSF